MREWPGALRAHRTRAMKQCSFDARSKGQPRALPQREMKRNGRPSHGLMARLGKSIAKQSEGRAGKKISASGWAGETVARSGRSIRPHPWEITSKLGGNICIVRCAQWRPVQQLPWGRRCDGVEKEAKRPSLEARSGRSISPHPWEITSKLGRNIYIVRCALWRPVCNSLGRESVTV